MMSKMHLRYRGWYGHKPFIFKNAPDDQWISAHPAAGTYESFVVDGHQTHADAIAQVDNQVRVHKIRAIQDGAA